MKPGAGAMLISFFMCSSKPLANGKRIEEQREAQFVLREKTACYSAGFAIGKVVLSPGNAYFGNDPDWILLLSLVRPRTNVRIFQFSGINWNEFGARAFLYHCSVCKVLICLRKNVYAIKCITFLTSPSVIVRTRYVPAGVRSAHDAGRGVGGGKERQWLW